MNSTQMPLVTPVPPILPPDPRAFLDKEVRPRTEPRPQSANSDPLSFLCDSSATHHFSRAAKFHHVGGRTRGSRSDQATTRLLVGGAVAVFVLFWILIVFVLYNAPGIFSQ
jgi:hypothetical protein